MKKKNSYPFAVIILLILLLSCSGDRETSTANNGPLQSDGSSDNSNGPSHAPGTDPDSVGDGKESESQLIEINRGYEVWLEAGCIDCHRIGDDPGGDIGPELTGIGDRLSRNELFRFIRDPRFFDPDNTMPPQDIDDNDLDYLTTFLAVLSSDTADAM